MKETNTNYCYRYPRPAVTADCVVFGYDDIELKVLLIKRGNEPYKDCWAFPGGFLNMEETIEACAHRELEEETGLSNVPLEQFYTFSEVHRDPRERVISVAFFGFIKITEVKGADDATDAKWFPIDHLPDLAFDHNMMFEMAYHHFQEKIEKISSK